MVDVEVDDDDDDVAFVVAVQHASFETVACWC